MKGFHWIIILLMLTGCGSDELSSISVRNMTEIPLYVQPYSSDFTDGNWIQPGLMEDFYTINCDCLDGFRYFSFYYDSLIIHIKDMEDQPIKFYKDGTTINYDPTLSPFTNPDVWRIKESARELPGKVIRSNYEDHLVYEHYFCISTASIKSLKQVEVKEMTPSF
jgi:hypothetical protein